MGKLIVLRHGQSQWNLENLFAGWSNNPPLLTKRGIEDVRKVANVLRDIEFDFVFCSRLRRAQETRDVLVEELSLQDLPLIDDACLNERHYGDLQGAHRVQMVEQYGVEQVQQWRRTFTGVPPNGESIEMCSRRVLPFFRQYILPHVNKGRTILIVAHGNSLRSIFKELDDSSDAEVAALEIPLCTPFVYEIEHNHVLSKVERFVPDVVTRGGSLTEKRVKE